MPGPSVAFTISPALTFGRRTALINVVGNTLGLVAQVVGAAFGRGRGRITNPKTIAVFVIFLPQRCPRLRASAQLITLNLILPITALVLDSVWALAAGTASKWLSRSPRRLAATGGTGRLVMIGLGVSLAATARKD